MSGFCGLRGTVAEGFAEPLEPTEHVQVQLGAQLSQLHSQYTFPTHHPQFTLPRHNRHTDMHKVKA